MTSGFAASIGFATAAFRLRLLDRASTPGRRLAALAALAAAGGIASFLVVALPAAADSTVIGLSAPGGQSRRPPPPHKWTTFVKVDGQPESVPAEWVATPEGRFAHSIRIPNPVPKDSGYRWWMSAQDYFKHLCDTEAGEFIYEKVENVEGFLFLRPPGRPDDSDLTDKYTLEAPGFEAVYQVLGSSVDSRSTLFVSSSRPFKFIEEPTPLDAAGKASYLHASGSSTGLKLDNVQAIDQPEGEFVVTWRGLRRRADRHLQIAGFEVIVLRRGSDKVVAVLRDYLYSAVPGGRVNWLSASYCPRFVLAYGRPQLNETPEFLIKVLHGNRP